MTLRTIEGVKEPPPPAFEWTAIHHNGTRPSGYAIRADGRVIGVVWRNPTVEDGHPCAWYAIVDDGAGEVYGRSREDAALAAGVTPPPTRQEPP